MNITYDVLNKVSKQELIAWMKDNVLLPSISDEQFLKDVRLKFLLSKEKDLLEQDRVLNNKLEDTIEDLHYYLDNNEENGVVFVPKFVIEKIINQQK